VADGDVTPVRGRAEEIELFEVLWQQEDATSMLPSIEIDARTGHSPKRVRLRHAGRELVLGDRRESLTMGRADENDVVVHGPLISRIHARIEIARNKVLLVDQSTNGTFVIATDGKESFVRRDSLELTGQGTIGLGKLPDATDVIRFQVEE
jgi:adenylate cyclase